jgi:caa(3)-type oxidase subunit IV
MTASAPAAHDHHGNHGHSHGADAHEEHIHPPSFYIKTWGILMVLLIVSIVGPMAEIRALTLLTAFGVAVVKAVIVCSRFMHLDVEKRWVVYFLSTSLGFLALFFFAIAPDILKHEGTNWVNVGAINEIARHDLTVADHGHHAEHGETHESEDLKSRREEAAKKLEGIAAAMKAVAQDLAAPPAPPTPAPAAALPATP